MNQETLDLIQKPRCGIKDRMRRRADRGNNLSAQALIRKKRFILYGGQHRKLRVSYSLNGYPARYNSSRELVDEQIKRAFDIWSEHAQIDFKKVDGNADIKMSFAERRHKPCGMVFDGSGSELAHAFAPDEESEVHFDLAENWSTNGDDPASIDIFTTAAHEIGHALGIAHSYVNESLMAPRYVYIPKLKLHSDDIAGIQELYGERFSKEKQLERKQQPTPDLCEEPSFDAITRIQNGSTYIFKGNYYWPLTDSGLAKIIPDPIAKGWPGLPGSIDAAATFRDNRTYFFKGDKYWSFMNMQPESGYPKLIKGTFKNIPNNIDAVFMYNQDNEVYFFKGDKYWRYNQDSKESVYGEYPRSITDYWRGVPSNLNDVFTWEDNRTFFFKGNQYYRFNEQDDEVDGKADPPFPRPTAYWWLACGTSTLNQTSPSSNDNEFLTQPDGELAKANLETNRKSGI